MNEQQIDKYLKITIALIIVVVLATGGLYFFYYKQPGVGKLTIVEQQIAELQKQAKKKPRNLSLRIILAKAYLKNEQYNEAIRELKQALKIEKKSQSALYLLGFAYKLKGKRSYGLAEKQFKKIIELGEGKQYAKINPNLKSSYYFLGEMAFESNKYKKALDYFKKSAKVGNTDADALRYIGRSYLGLKKYKKAEENLSMALKFVPSYAEAYYDLGQVYEAQGKKKDAKKNYEKALKHESDYKEAEEALDNL